jgi:hypothetical protein
MERIMRNPSGGAIGIIGATVTTYRGEFRDENSYGNWWLAKEFFRILYDESPHPGEALYKQKENYINYIFSQPSLPFETELFRMFYIDNLAYNLLGDPEGPIWLNIPKELEVEYPGDFDQDNTSVTIRVRDTSTGQPVQGATVTMRDPQDEDVYFVTTSNSDGEVIFYYRPESLLSLQLTVTKEGFIPFIDEMNVISRKNLKMMEGLTFDPQIPVLGRPFTVSARVVNDGEVPLDNVLVRMELRSGESQQTPDKHILRMEPGEIVIVNLSFNPYRGINQIKASALLLSDSVESDLEDNSLSASVKVNEPLVFGSSLPNLETLEDTRLSNYNKPLNVSTYVIDPDEYPSIITYQTETLKGDLIAEIDGNGLLDILPGHDWNGEGIIRVYASDGSVTVSSDLRIVVRAVPDPPVFISWPDFLEGYENLPINFEVELQDVDSSELILDSPDVEEFSFERLNNVSGMVYNITIVPSDIHVGNSLLTITATDNTLETSEVRISMEVSTTNDPPEVVHPDKVSVREGDVIEIPLDIFDPDNDREIFVGASGNIVDSYFFENGVLYVTPVEGTGKGTYDLDIWVNDNDTGGNRTFRLEINIQEPDKEPILVTFLILLGVIVLVLVAYGIVIRTQESRQREMLDKVGDEVMFSRTRTRSVNKQKVKVRHGTIPAPPSPKEMESNFTRKKRAEMSYMDGDEKEVTAFQDLETELDDIIEELYPPGVER